MFDGFDEYRSGSNKYIDAAIKKESLGHCRILLTSRNTSQLSDPYQGGGTDNSIRDCMDIEMVIKGFDERSTEDYAAKFLSLSDSRSDKKAAMDEANKLYQKVMEIDGLQHSSGISSLIKVPLFNQMLCVLSRGKDPLPETKGGVLLAFIKRSVDRESLKKTGMKQRLDLNTILKKLGQVAWESLQQLGRDSQQLLISEVCNIF